MARSENHREDMLREATALRERGEWKVAGFPEQVIVGFRSGGAASFFFGEDPVYQFNNEGAFRRGYAGGKLIKATPEGLARLTRVRKSGEVQLQRYDFTSEEVQAYLQQMDEDLTRLQTAMDSNRYETVGIEPAEVDVTARVVTWLAQRPRPIPLATRPNV